MWLRDVELTDVAAYLRMRCDPGMMAELGGPLPVEGMAEQVRRDVEPAAADERWTKMIVLDAAGRGAVAGTVTLWEHREHREHREAGAAGAADAAGASGPALSEIGWMVLPEFQGRGLGKRAVRELLRLARLDGRWGVVSAFPGVGNAASNGICRSLGFTLASERLTEFAGRSLLTNHWTIET